jgi:quinone-modifying oxidoreductase subunit QmoA
LNFPTLIIGGGISGITAAVELAEAGHEVVLIEKEPYLGGNVSRFNNYFPKLCPPACGLEINYRRIRSSPRISYYTGAQVDQIKGSEGDFTVDIAVEARLINNMCTSCGKCAEVCPENRYPVPGRDPEEKAAYIPGGLAFPMKYTIDPEVCKKDACAKCLEVCNYDAIQLDAKPAEIVMRVGKIVVATGWKLYDVSRIENYHYSKEADVITNLEFEYLMASCTRDHKKLTRPSDGKIPRRIAFIQCAGSRDVKHLPYCSAVCCPASLKHALTIAENYPEIKTEIFYIDMRITGRNEKLLKKAQDTAAITLTRGKAGRIERDQQSEGLVVEVEDVTAGSRRRDSFDLVVLAAGLVPNHITVTLPTNMHGFYEVDPVPGIVPAATCKRPMDVASSVRDATAAVLRTMHV